MKLFSFDTNTGSGWLTLDVERVYLYGELFPLYPNGYGWLANCDPIIKLFINDEKLLKTTRSINGFSFDAKITFTTSKILKNSTIRIEIWDSRKGFMNPNVKIFGIKGTVNAFLNKQRSGDGDNFSENANRIETVSFWRDEYE